MARVCCPAHSTQRLTDGCSKIFSKVLYSFAKTSLGASLWTKAWQCLQIIVPYVLRKLLVGSPWMPGGRRFFKYVGCVSLGIKWWNVSSICRPHISHRPSSKEPSAPSSSTTASIGRMLAAGVSCGLPYCRKTTWKLVSPSACCTTASCHWSSSASTAKTRLPTSILGTGAARTPRRQSSATTHRTASSSASSSNDAPASASTSDRSRCQPGAVSGCRSAA
mmetsp:Transcript_62882/g.192358  ORF Transcript_62882/g.192358 Transcript_62882/m.192358 type:complete len:221 (+) Transcript_62882:93-755(+)